MTGVLRTERDVVWAMAGTVTLEELYAQVEAAAEVDRDGGADVIHGRGDLRWKRRVRCALQDLRKRGLAERVGDGTWVLAGTREEPRGLVLLLAGPDLTSFELSVADAAAFLAELAEDDLPVDLVLADPPYALNRGRGIAEDVGERTYAGDRRQVVDGYVEIDVDRYPEFTRRWVGAAAGLLAVRPGGYLAVVTGPQQAARVQVEAETAGLTYVNSVCADRPFALRSTRRFAHAHYVVSVLCSGPLDSVRRTFNPPSDQRAASGRLYPLDLWLGTGKPDRPGRVRYDNTLPLGLCRRIVGALTNPGDLVADPFVGGGATGIAAWELRRHFRGADLNPGAVRFTAARLAVEHLPARPLF